MRRASLVLIALFLLTPLASAGENVVVDPGLDGVSVDVIESGSGRTVVEYRLGSFTESPVDIHGRTFLKITLPGESDMRERGMPELPHIARSLAIPDDAEMAVRIVSASHVDLPATPVAPSKGPIARNVDPDTVPYTFAYVYESDTWYPQDLAFGREPYIMRDVRGMVLVVHPFQYNPATETLRVYTNVVVEVIPIGPGKVNVLERRPSSAINAEFDKIYRRHFINYDSVPALRYASVGEVGNMLVICYDDFMASMEPFVDWKRQMGIPCEMVSVTDAGGTATNIKSYIQNYYDTNGLAFVLLVGDSDQVPTLSAAGGASDPSYSLVAGSDSYPDLFVGRFSAETTAHVETQVLRSVEYEKLPASGGAWYHKGTGIASDQGPGDDDEYDYEHIDNIRTDLLGFTYTEVDQIYDPTATAAMVANALNDGRSIVNYCGHGSTTSWSSSGFSSSDVNALTNDNMLPFIISVACVNGYFNGPTCFAEAWLRATNGDEPTGAIATYMSSINQDWNSPMAAQDESIDLLVAEAKRTFGGICYDGSCLMMDEYGSIGEDMFKTWHIFGDPSIRVRTDTPTALAVAHDATVAPSATSFDVTVSGVEGALCALYYNGTLYGSAFTDAAGSATISISEALPTDVDLTLTVTAFNAIPYFGTVHVGQTYVPQIDVSPAYFDVVLEPDETLVDTLHISNVGEPLSVLHYDLEIVDAGSRRNLTGSTMTVSPTSYEPGTTADFVFSIYNGSPDDEWINGASLDFPSGVTVNSATDFVVSSRRLTWDGATGDGAYVTWSGDAYDIVYPGETATATVNLSIDAGFTGVLSVPYTLDGDGWGSAPHSVSGTVSLDPPAGPTVTLTAPNGGEAWGVGEWHDITWEWTGNFDLVSLSCSTDSGSTWTAITSSTENDGVYPWLVDASVSNACFVKIVGQTDPAIEDLSDGSFSVYQPITWLSASPTTGDVEAGESAPVELTFDATGLSEGDYYADILIDSNGGDQVVVPVALHVQATGVDTDLPRITVLYGNYPNPFNPKTTIAFALPTDGHVRVRIYDASGRLVRTLVDGTFEAGSHEVPWDGKDDRGTDVASGVYFYRMEAGGRALGGKMALMK